LDKAQQQQPDIFSIFWNGRQILRIENGVTVLERPVCPGPGLLTAHFNDEPNPEYVLTIP
jgi:hypothetical protein